jgi:hypothetical protein
MSPLLWYTCSPPKWQMTVGKNVRFAHAFSVYKEGRFSLAPTCSTGFVVTVECPTPRCGQMVSELRHRRYPVDVDDMFGNSTGRRVRETGKTEVTEQGRIVGGTAASPGSYPHLCALWHNEFYACGVSILTERFLLTAAHCFHVWASPT